MRFTWNSNACAARGRLARLEVLAVARAVVAELPPGLYCLGRLPRVGRVRRLEQARTGVSRS